MLILSCVFVYKYNNMVWHAAGHDNGHVHFYNRKILGSSLAGNLNSFSRSLDSETNPERCFLNVSRPKAEVSEVTLHALYVGVRRR